MALWQLDWLVSYESLLGTVPAGEGQLAFEQRTVVDQLQVEGCSRINDVCRKGRKEQMGT